MLRTERRSGWSAARRFAVGSAAVCALGMGFSAPAQAAEFGLDGPFTAQAVKLLSVSSTGETTEEITQAGAHPDALLLDFQLNTAPTGVRGSLQPVESLKDVHVELPPGTMGNPEATPKCTMDTVQDAPGNCPQSSIVGFHVMTANGSRGDVDTLTDLIYNVVPPRGAVARFAMKASGLVPTTFDMRVNSDGRYTISTDINNVSQILQLFRSQTFLFGVPAALNGPGGWRLRLGGRGPGEQVPLLTLGTECGRAQPVKIQMDSWSNPGRWVEASYLSPALTGCDRLSFAPKLDLRPTTRAAATPSGYAVRLDVPQNNLPKGLATPNVRKVDVLLPEGVTINPSSVQGLEGCSDEQAAIRSLEGPSCSSASRIGSVRIETPVLAGPLEGSVYLGTPKSMQAQSGEMFRVFLVASGYGVTIKQEGRITPDPVTGRLRTVFDTAPQQPFSSMQVNFNGGPRSPLVNPDRCGTFTTSAKLTAWSGAEATSESSFSIDCRPGLGGFAPSFTAGAASPFAGISSPFHLSIGKPDGQSALSGLAMTFPPGLLAHLKGNLGSQVGTATVLAGAGTEPYPFSGKVFLEGAYGDAPFSLRVVVPAKAGPYDLGDVVVRQKIYIDPHDAHVTIVSDPLPTILQGVPVRLQRLDVSVDKPGFMRNPTTCEPLILSGVLAAAMGQTAPVSNRFQVGGCADLPLKPKLKMDLTGKKETKRGKHPKLSATMTQKTGESGLKKVKIRLPLSLALDPDNAQALCKPEQAAAKSCPAGSIVGKATAVTPLLDRPLTGNVYFVEGTRRTAEGRIAKTLPKLWVALRGQVTLDVWADSAIGKGQALETTFGFVPDAPISSFKIDINGGAHGILAVTGAHGASLCKQALTSKADYDGQNGKHVTSTVGMGSPCGFQVAKKSLTSTHATVTVAGIGAGKLTISGKGIRKASRTIKSASVATIQPRLTSTGMRTAKSGKSLRLRVSFNPKAKGKTRHVTAVVKRAKKAAAR